MEKAFSSPENEIKALGLVKYYQVIRGACVRTNNYEGCGGSQLIFFLCKIWLSFSAYSTNHTSHLKIVPKSRHGRIISRDSPQRASSLFSSSASLLVDGRNSSCGVPVGLVMDGFAFSFTSVIYHFLPRPIRSQMSLCFQEYVVTGYVTLLICLTTIRWGISQCKKLATR